MKGIYFALMTSLFTQSVFAQEITLGEAIDAPELEWRYTLGSVPMIGTADPEAIGEDIASADLNIGQFTEISTILPSSGIIDFWIDGGTLSKWSASINGVELDLSSGSWPYGFHVDGEGPHTFKIRHVAEFQESTVTIDGVVFRPDATATLAEALDQDGAVWTSPDATKWVGSPYFSHDGEDAAWIGGLADEETSSLKTTIEGPAEFSFWWQTTRGSYTRGELLINGSLADGSPQPRQNRWQHIVYVLGEGSHEIEWRATGRTPWKESPARGLWVDQFKVTTIEEGFLVNFAPPLPGARFFGESRLTAPGTEAGSTAISLNREHCQYDEILTWPIPPSTEARRISFLHKSAYGEVRVGGQTVNFSSQDSWEKLTIPLTADATSVQIISGGAPALIDQFEIQLAQTLPPEEIIGDIAQQLDFNGWHGWPTGPESPVTGLFSASFGATISGSLTGPAWLSVESERLGSSTLSLSVDGQTVLTSETDPFRYLIPPGTHAITIWHSSNEDSFGFIGGEDQSWVTITDIDVSPIEAFPLGEMGGLQLNQSGNSFRTDPQSGEDLPWEPFFQTAEGEIHAVVGPAQNIQLSSQVRGPALISFDRKVDFHREYDPYIYDVSGGPCTTGTITINVDPRYPPADPGTTLIVNGISSFASGESGGMFIPISALAETAQEPMDEANPLLMPEFRPVLLGERKPSTQEGWESITFFVGPGDHELIWTLGASINDSFNYGHSAQWNHLMLANLKLAPVMESYADWADQHWTADPEVDNAVTKLGPWQDPNADPDGDGFSNSLEFALGSNPRLADEFPLISSQVFSGTNPAVLWSVDTPNNILRTLVSTDLKTWTEEGVSTSISEAGILSELATPAPKAFFKLEADVTEPQP